MEAGEFEIELRKSGRVLKVPAEKSILDVLAENGVYVMTSCESGVCGTCVTAVLEGTPEHRDDYQTDAEKRANTHVTVCVSRSRTGRLILDL